MSVASCSLLGDRVQNGGNEVDETGIGVGSTSEICKNHTRILSKNFLVLYHVSKIDSGEETSVGLCSCSAGHQ